MNPIGHGEYLEESKEEKQAFRRSVSGMVYTRPGENRPQTFGEKNRERTALKIHELDSPHVLSKSLKNLGSSTSFLGGAILKEMAIFHLQEREEGLEQPYKTSPLSRSAPFLNSASSNMSSPSSSKSPFNALQKSNSAESFQFYHLKEFTQSEEELKESVKSKEEFVVSPLPYSFDRSLKVGPSVTKAREYCLLLGAVEGKNQAQLIKKKNTEIQLQTDLGVFPFLTKSKEINASFKAMLEVAKETEEEDRFVALALLQSMRKSAWVKGIPSFRVNLKKKLNKHYVKTMDRAIAEFSLAFMQTLQQLTVQELKNHKLSTGQSALMREHCPTIYHWQRVANCLRFKAIDNILALEDVKQRGALIEMFIQMADRALFKHKDFATASFIVAGLESGPILDTRLKQTWNCVSEKFFALRRDLIKEVTLKPSTYQKDMERMENYDVPALDPFLTRLALIVKNIEGFQDGIEAVEKQWQADVSFLKECSEWEQRSLLSSKIEEWREEIKVLEGDLETEKKLNEKGTDGERIKSLKEQIEKIRHWLYLTQFVEEAEGIHKVSFSHYQSQIEGYKVGIEKFEGQIEALLNKILEISNKKSSCSTSGVKEVDIDLSLSHIGAMEEEAYKKSCELERPRQSLPTKETSPVQALNMLKKAHSHQSLP